MALTSLSAVTSTLVAGPSGRKVPLQSKTYANWDISNALAAHDKKIKKLPPLSPEQVKANIENDKNNGILQLKSGVEIAGFKITKDFYEFDPEAYKKAFGEKPFTIAQFKQRYGLPDGLIKEQLGDDCPGDKNAYEVNRKLSIPKEYIDKK